MAATKLSDEQVRRMREARRDGATYSELRDRFGGSDKFISRACKGEVRQKAGGPIEGLGEYAPAPVRADDAGEAVEGAKRCGECGGKYVGATCFLCHIRRGAK